MSDQVRPSARRGPVRREPGRAAPVAAPNEQLEQARAIALRTLTHAPKSEAELRGKLVSRGVAPDVADELLGRLRGVGLVDDQGYAEMIVRTRQAERGLARRAIAAELARRGIAPDIRQRALDHIDTHDEIERARDLAERKSRSMGQLDPQVRWRRLAGMLQRKGYSPSVVTSVLRDLGAHNDLGGDDTGM